MSDAIHENRRSGDPIIYILKIICICSPDCIGMGMWVTLSEAEGLSIYPQSKFVLKYYG